LLLAEMFAGTALQLGMLQDKHHVTRKKLFVQSMGVLRYDCRPQQGVLGQQVCYAVLWCAVVQVAYADGLSVLSHVLVEMRTIIGLGLQWEDQVGA
jgi:hypothetical protein